MKNIKVIICLSLILFMLSCNDDNNNIFPERYNKILALKNDGVHYLDFNTTTSIVKDSLLILKGGGNPFSESSFSLRIMTKEEACKEWKMDELKINVLPENTYKLDDISSMVMDSKEEHKYVRIMFYPSKVEVPDNVDNEMKWILPIELESVNDTINKQKNKILYLCKINKPKVDWNNLFQETNDAEIIYKTLDFSLTLGVTNAEYNNIDFTASVDLSEEKKLIDDYNILYGTNYKALPKSSYSLSDFSFDNQKMTVTNTLKLKREGLVSDETYLLPLKIELSTDLIAKSENVKYIRITNPKYVYGDINNKLWKVIFCNSECGWSWDAWRLIDGDSKTAWTTKYDGDPASNFEDDMLYYPTSDVRFQYHPYDYYCCWAKRDLKDVHIVIDLGESVTIGAVGFGKSTNEWGDRVLKDCKIEIANTFNFKSVREGGLKEDYNLLGNEPEGWNFIFDCKNMTSDIGDYWFSFSSDTDVEKGDIVKGRYLKLTPYGTSHGGNPNCNSFCELYLKKLISVDGEEVK